jgi:hypothetical protein
MATSSSRLPVVIAIVGEWEHPTIKILSPASSGTCRGEGFSSDSRLPDWPG